jgi:WXG100 family type VII secretion target
VNSVVKVTFGELAAAQANIDSTVRAVNGQLDDLSAFLAPMVASWEGEAAQTYHHLQRQWDSAAAELNQVLAQIAAAVGTANEQYQQAERVNTSRFR